MNCLVFIRAYCGFRRINLHGINVSFIIYCMFASNNKPSKRSARAERKAAHASSSRTPHRSAGSASDPYVRTSRASHASRRPSGSSTNAYGASNYGSSTQVSLFTHNKRAIIVRSVLMVRPPSAARILLAMRMIARSFALSASARRSVASALRSVWLPFA